MSKTSSNSCNLISKQTAVKSKLTQKLFNHDIYSDYDTFIEII